MQNGKWVAPLVANIGGGSSSPADMICNLLLKLMGESAMEMLHGTEHTNCLRNVRVYGEKPPNQLRAQAAHSGCGRC